MTIQDIKNGVKVMSCRGQIEKSKKLRKAVKAYESGKITRPKLKEYYYQLFI